MTDKEKKARLVIRSDTAGTSGQSTNPSDFNTYINMGNFCNNTNDMVYLEVDYMTPVVMSTNDTVAGGTATNPVTLIKNVYDAIEVFIDFPQQDSFDTLHRTNTYHICTLDREGPAQSEVLTSEALAQGMAYNSEMWQKWVFKNKPSHIVMRPEVLQQKTAHIRLQFVADDKPVYNNVVAGHAPNQYQFINDFVLVMSVTK